MFRGKVKREGVRQISRRTRIRVKTENWGNNRKNNGAQSGSEEISVKEGERDSQRLGD